MTFLLLPTGSKGGSPTPTPTPEPSMSPLSALTEASGSWNYRKWRTRDWVDPRSGSYLLSTAHTLKPLYETDQDYRHHRVNPLLHCGERQRLSSKASSSLLGFAITMEIAGCFTLLVVLIFYIKQIEREDNGRHKAQMLLVSAAITFHCVSWGCWCGYAGQYRNLHALRRLNKQLRWTPGGYATSLLSLFTIIVRYLSSHSVSALSSVPRSVVITDCPTMSNTDYITPSCVDWDCEPPVWNSSAYRTYWYWSGYSYRSYRLHGAYQQQGGCTYSSSYHCSGTTDDGHFCGGCSSASRNMYYGGRWYGEDGGSWRSCCYSSAYTTSYTYYSSSGDGACSYCANYSYAVQAERSYICHDGTKPKPGEIQSRWWHMKKGQLDDKYVHPPSPHCLFAML